MLSYPSLCARRGLSALLIFTTLCLTPVCAQQMPLSLEAAQHAAVTRSREIPGKESAARAAREQAVAAGRLPDPMLQLGIDNLPIEGADRFSLNRDFMTMRRIGLAQAFTRQAKRRAGTARYEQEAGLRLAERDAAIAGIRRQSAMAWLERHFAERLLNAMDEQLSAARTEIKAAEGAYRAGRGTQAEVIAAHVTLAELEDRRGQQELRVARARIALARWVGDVAQDSLAPPPSLDTLPVDAESLPHALARHPEIVALQRRHDTALAEAEVARADRAADWTAELSYAQRGPEFSNMISFGLSIPLQWDQKRRQDRELAARLALADEALALREETEREHAAQTQAMLAEWRSLHARISRYRDGLIPLATEATRARLAAYAGGKGSLTDLTSSRRAELDARLRALELEAEAAQLWAQLATLVPREGPADSSHTATTPRREAK